jgi:hypothetical protein
MPLISEGLVQDIEQWSEATSSIMHFWETRQRYNPANKSWHGDYEILVFLGSKKMRFTFVERINKYYISKNDFDDPTLLFEMLEEVSGITTTSIDEIEKNTLRGDWIIKDNKIIQAPKMGFSIGKINDPAAVFGENYILDVNDNQTSLFQVSNIKVLSITTGLMTSSYKFLSLPDFDTYGLSFIDLMNIGAFTRDFDVSYKSVSSIKELIHDLEVKKPLVSQTTIDRLHLQGDWNIREKSEEKDLDVMEITTAEEKEDMPEDIIEWLKESDEELLEVKDTISWDIGSLSSFIGEFFLTDFFNNVQLMTDIHFPRRTFIMIKNLKYDLICMLVTTMGNVNRSTIQDVYNLIDDQKSNVVYSLISRYDRIVSDTGETSPEIVVLKFDPHLFRLGMTRKQMESLIEL